MRLLADDDAACAFLGTATRAAVAMNPLLEDCPTSFCCEWWRGENSRLFRRAADREGVENDETASDKHNNRPKKAMHFARSMIALIVCMVSSPPFILLSFRQRNAVRVMWSPSCENDDPPLVNSDNHHNLKVRRDMLAPCRDRRCQCMQWHFDQQFGCPVKPARSDIARVAKGK